MKEVPVLGLIRPALVDDEDYDRVKGFTWRANYHRTGKIYVQTGMHVDGKMRTVKLHRFIMSATADQMVDHRHHDGLDNRREHLRLCTNQQNQYNRRKLRAKTSRYKGVFRRENGKWRATIRFDNKLVNIGTYPAEDLAAAAYNEKARELFGDFALLNDVPQCLEAKASEVVTSYRDMPPNGQRFFGVTRSPYQKRNGEVTWVAKFRGKNGQNIHCGTFSSEIEAAREYNRRVVNYGANKRLNTGV